MTCKDGPCAERVNGHLISRAYNPWGTNDGKVHPRELVISSQQIRDVVLLLV